MNDTTVDRSTGRIMVVEDNRQNRELLAKVLKRWGYNEVECLGDPREFMERFRQISPQLIFLDCRMPYFSGPELLGQLRKEPGAMERTRVVMLTGDSGADLAEEVMDQGASAIVTKPYMLNELKDIVARLLRELETSEEAG